MGLAIWQNGYAEPTNILWRWIQSVWSFELLLLKIILGGFAIYAITSIIFSFYSFQEKQKSKSESKKEDLPETTAITLLPIVTDQVQPLMAVGKPIESNPAPPTAQELKRKALKQITGKEFLK